jgi:hypothetical protein
MRGKLDRSEPQQLEGKRILTTPDILTLRHFLDNLIDGALECQEKLMSNGFLNLNMVVENLSKAFKSENLGDRVTAFVSTGLCKHIS